MLTRRRPGNRVAFMLTLQREEKMEESRRTEITYRIIFPGVIIKSTAEIQPRGTLFLHAYKITKVSPTLVFLTLFFL